MAAKNINVQELRDLIESNKPVLVDFWATWCPHCRKINPAYEQIAEEYAGRLEVVKVDVDQDETLWEELELIPTLRLYMEGKPVDSIVAPQSKAAIEAFLAGVMPKEKKETEKHLYDTIIIGGGPGGYTAALYAARAGLDTLVVERLSAGGQMALTHQIDNYPGFVDGIGGYELAEQMQRQAERFGAQTRNAQVQSVDLRGNPKVVETSEGTFYARTVMLATGANPRELGLPEEKELVGRGVAYCAACDGMAYRGKTVAVAGGGNSAVADALMLAKLCAKVYLIHRRDTLTASKVYLKALRENGIEILWNSRVTRLLHDGRLTGVELAEVNTDRRSKLACDGLFVAIGRIPDTGLAAGQAATDSSGYLVADETTRTSIPGVFAVGDLRTKPMRQIVTAAADGAVASRFVEEYLVELFNGQP